MSTPKNGLPIPPSNPFIFEGDADTTCNAIKVVLAFLHNHVFKEVELGLEGSISLDNDHLCGHLRILEGLESAVDYLS